MLRWSLSCAVLVAAAELLLPNRPSRNLALLKKVIPDPSLSFWLLSFRVRLSYPELEFELELAEDDPLVDAAIGRV